MGEHLHIYYTVPLKTLPPHPNKVTTMLCDGNLKILSLFPSVLERNYSLTKWWWLCQKEECREGREREDGRTYIKACKKHQSSSNRKKLGEDNDLYQVSPGPL